MLLAGRFVLAWSVRAELLPLSLATHTDWEDHLHRDPYGRILRIGIDLVGFGGLGITEGVFSIWKWY